MCEKIVVFRNISKEDATKEISEWLQSSGKSMYPSDISEQLRIDCEMVDDVLADLRAQGKVE